MNDIIPVNRASGQFQEASSSIEPKSDKAWSLRQQGALFYIISPEGQQVSDGYHSFEAYKVDIEGRDAIVAIGQIGAMKTILRLENGRVMKSQGEFHDLVFREDIGMFVVKTGALLKLIDPVSGAPLHERGYHSIYQDGLGVFYGTLGTKIERIEFNIAPKGFLKGSINFPAVEEKPLLPA